MAKVEYLGIATVPISWLAFALQYTDREGQLTPRNLALLSALPLVTLLPGVDQRGARASLELNETERRRAVSSSGSGSWRLVLGALLSYSYLLLLVGTTLLISMLTRSPKLYRKQNLALLVAVSVPWVGNGVCVLGLSLVPNLDLTPFESL